MDKTIKDISKYMEGCSLEEQEKYAPFVEEIAQKYYSCETEEELDEMQDKLWDEYKDIFPYAAEVIIKLYYNNLVRIWWKGYGITFS